MVNECFRCGVSGENVMLYNAIGEKGIVSVCSDCASLEHLPIIKKPTDEQIIDSKRQKSVRDMLSGINRGGKLLAGREVSLRELVDRNLKSRETQSHPDLVENFHWDIQRIRRNRKITREQFAKGIGESEATVRMIEQGVLPGNNYQIVNKIEGYLGISLRKPGKSGFPETPTEEPKKPWGVPMPKEPAKDFTLDRESSSKLKIADLREMKKQKEQEKKQPIDSWREKRNEAGDEMPLDDEDFLDTEFEDSSEDDEI